MIMNELDTIIGRFISASNQVRNNLVTEIRRFCDRKVFREDARCVLQAYRDAKVEEEQALDLLGFGEQLAQEPRAPNDDDAI